MYLYEFMSVVYIMCLCVIECVCVCDLYSYMPPLGALWEECRASVQPLSSQTE